MTRASPQVCPECGRPPHAPPRRRWRWWAVWPVLLAVMIAAAVWWWAPRNPFVGSVASASVTRPLEGDITVAELRRVAAGEAPVGRLRSALRDGGLAPGFVPELSTVSVGGFGPPAGGLKADVGEFRETLWGWPARWAVFRRDRGGDAMPPVSPGVTWRGSSLFIGHQDVLVAWTLDVDGLRLLADLVLPALAVAGAGHILGRRRAVLLATAVVLLAGIGWTSRPRYRWLSSGISTTGLSMTLAELRDQARTEAGCMGLAGKMLAAIGGRDDGVLVAVQVDSSRWGIADQVMLPGFTTLWGMDTCDRGDGEPPITLRAWADDRGVNVLLPEGRKAVRHTVATWEGVGLVAGAPAALWLMWAGARGVWRARRDPRGERCRSCGYDLRGLAAGPAAPVGPGGTA